MLVARSAMNRTLRLAAAALALLPAAPLMAADTIPTARGSADGFTAIAAIITDRDWEEKWRNSPVGEPRFETGTVLKVGDKAYVVTFYAGALLKDGTYSVSCDLVIRGPDGSTQARPDGPCGTLQPQLPDGTFIPTGLSIFLSPIEIDPEGLVVFELGVTDVHRGVRIPLTVSVEFDTK